MTETFCGKTGYTGDSPASHAGSSVASIVSDAEIASGKRITSGTGAASGTGTSSGTGAAPGTGLSSGANSSFGASTAGNPFFLGCSPRTGGNTDTALHAFADAFPHGQEHVCFLRNLPVSPCIACGACTRAVAKNHLRLPDALEPSPDLAAKEANEQQPANRPLFGCPLTTKDKSVPLLSSLVASSVLCLAAPIYFYFFPAQVKALLDRTQPFWDLFSANHRAVTNLPRRLCYPILIAGRPKGEKLFDGSMISLRSALRNLNIEIAEPLLLRGLDGPKDLQNNPETLDRIRAYGHKAYAEFSRQNKEH